MKRLAVLLSAFGVAWFSAFSSGPVAAYQPVEAEEFFADPVLNPPSGFFEAIVEGCFPGEQVVFFNVGVSPIDVIADTCDTTSFEASVTFQAPADEGEYNLFAFLAAETSSNPDIPDRPNRLLNTTYIVDADVVVVTGGDGAVGFSGGAGPTFTATAGTGDRWPDFVTSVGFYRTFLALLALLVGIFFVWLWRRRREDEEQARGYAGSPMPAPDPNTPNLA
jgi:hypothetical protein